MSTPGRTDATNSTMICLASNALGAGTLAANGVRWYVPGNIAIRRVRFFIGTKTGTAGTVAFQVRNQSTSVLSTNVSSGANAAMPFTSAATLSPDDVRVLDGNYVRIDWTVTAGTQTALTGYREAFCQIDWDLLGPVR